jgi:hypothetical protein
MRGEDRAQLAVKPCRPWRGFWMVGGWYPGLTPGATVCRPPGWRAVEGGGSSQSGRLGTAPPGRSGADGSVPGAKGSSRSQCAFLPPAQRVGRPQPSAEAEGRCPGKMPWEERRPPSLRPERSREPDSARQLSRAFQAATCCHPSTQGIGLRPQPWAPFSQPVGPDRSRTP